MYMRPPLLAVLLINSVVCPEVFSVELNGKKRAERIQIPLKLAYALTIHKCQGTCTDS